MHREDRERAEICVQCGTPVVPGKERSFEFGVGNLLCWSCAIERGGEHDAMRDAWTVTPNVADFLDEAYGSAPHGA